MSEKDDEKNDKIGSNVVVTILKNIPVSVYVVVGSVWITVTTLSNGIKEAGIPLDYMGRAYAEAYEKERLAIIEQQSVEFDAQLEIRKKELDAKLKQDELQFQAQLELQKLQLEQEEKANVKLDVVIETLDNMTGQLKKNTNAIQMLAERVERVEKKTAIVDQRTVNFERWSCEHEQARRPDYCTND